MKLFIVFIVSLLLLKFCGSTDKKAAESKHSVDVLISKEKLDTITIDEKAAVLYSPDTVQIDKRKKKVKEEDFYAGADDYLFYMNSTAEFIDSIKLKRVDVEGRKILKFIIKDHPPVFINLDAMPELWGVYLFDPEKKPKLVDMISIDEEYKSYYGK